MAPGDGGTVVGSNGMSELIFPNNEVRITTEKVGRSMYPDCFYWPYINSVTTLRMYTDVDKWMRDHGKV